MTWWAGVLLGIYLLACVILIISVLLQPGKADAAALFGGGASTTAFGPRGTQNFLGWVTTVSAAIVIILALVFALPGTFSPSSVVQGGASVPVEQPTSPSGPASSTPQPNQPKSESAAPSKSESAAPSDGASGAAEKPTQPKK